MGVFSVILILLRLSASQNETQIFPPPVYHFAENFDSLDKWIPSESSKTGSPDMKYTGTFSLQTSGNGLLMETPMSHHGLSAQLDHPFDFTQTDSLYFQFETERKSKPDCGGSYVKLISSTAPLTGLDDSTPFSIMFGPDICGGHSKLHFIINFPHPISSEWEEKVCKAVESFKVDSNRHLYGLALKSDGTFEISVDNKAVLKGNLLSDMIPPINPPKLIPDESATRPENWDDKEEVVDESKVKPEDWDEGGEEMIPDLAAVKPSDWKDDELLMIPDESADMPDDWDVELDGDWESPLMENPKCGQGKCGEWIRPLKVNPQYKGPWKPSYIPNPNYMGEWYPPNITNPLYFYESTPYKRLAPITAVALELWTVEANVVFDNFILTSDPYSLANWTAQTFPVKSTPISYYVQYVFAYLAQNWALIGCVLCALVLFLLLLRWIRPSNVVEIPQPVEVVEEPVQESEGDSDDGTRQRNIN